MPEWASELTAPHPGEPLELKMPRVPLSKPSSTGVEHGPGGGGVPVKVSVGLGVKVGSVPVGVDEKVHVGPCVGVPMGVSVGVSVGVSRGGASALPVMAVWGPARALLAPSINPNKQAASSPTR